MAAVAFEYRWERGRYEFPPSLAAELVHRPLDVLVAVAGLARSRTLQQRL